MIAGERTTAYINSLDMGNTELLNQIEKEALETYVPIIRRETQSFLKTLLAAQKPKVILEVGTAIGFSALLMAEYSPADTRITTIEKYEKRIPIAKENFRRAGREEQITLLEGDAAEILKGLTGSYDFIFMDAAKTCGDKATILKVDFDKNKDLVEEYEVSGYPTLILMKDGKELKRLSGLQQKPLIVKMLEEQM